MSHLFSVGCYVEVAPNAKPGCNSEGGTAFIHAVNKENDAGSNNKVSFDAQHVLQKKISREVEPSRVTLKSIQTRGRRDGMPSLLSPSYATTKRVAEATSTGNEQPIKPKRARKGIKTTDELLLEDPIDAHKYINSRNNSDKYQF